MLNTKTLDLLERAARQHINTESADMAVDPGEVIELVAAAKREAGLMEEVEALRKAIADGAEGAFIAHMEERRLREAAEAERDRLAALVADRNAGVTVTD